MQADLDGEYPVLVGGYPQAPPLGNWVHVPHADDALRDPYRVQTTKNQADTGRTRLTGFAGAIAAASPGQHTFAATSATTAQPTWAARPLEERLRLVSLVRHRLLAAAYDMEAVLVAEGHPLTLARWQISGMLAAMHPDTIAQAHQAMLSRSSSLGRSVTLRLVPHGVVGIQAPRHTTGMGWTNGIWALACGNSVTVNLSPYAPLAGAWLYHRIVKPALDEMQAPPGVLSVLCSPARSTIRDWITSRDIRLIHYTGPTAAGRLIEETALGTGTPVILDTSGNDSVTVWKDADVDAAVQALATAWYASGQMPCAPRWVMVHPDVAEKTVHLLAMRAADTSPGLPSHPGTLLTPVTDPGLFTRHLEQAVSVGARLAAGSRLVDLSGAEHPNGPFIQPTVTWSSAGDAGDLAVLREEGFHPMLPVLVLDHVRTDADRLHSASLRIAHSGHGLRHSLWTGDADTAAHYVSWVRSGGILKINDSHVGNLPGMPAHGGTGDSGGIAALGAYQPWRAFTILQAVSDATALNGDVGPV